MSSFHTGKSPAECLASSASALIYCRQRLTKWRWRYVIVIGLFIGKKRCILYTLIYCIQCLCIFNAGFLIKALNIAKFPLFPRNSKVTKMFGVGAFLKIFKHLVWTKIHEVNYNEQKYKCNTFFLLFVLRWTHRSETFSKNNKSPFCQIRLTNLSKSVPVSTSPSLAEIIHPTAQVCCIKMLMRQWLL